MKWGRDGRGVVELPSGRLVRGRSLRVPSVPEPEWGLYATWRKPHPTWPHRWVRWPDFGLPIHNPQVRTAVAEAWWRSATERVEVACGGGRGRTGTLLAALVVLDGLDAGAAVTWVRRYYDPRAVETPWQRWWLATSTQRLRAAAGTIGPTVGREG